MDLLGRLLAGAALGVAIVGIAAAEMPLDVDGLVAARRRLVDARRFDEALALCRSWLPKTAATDRAEAHKCVANVYVAQTTRRDVSVFISPAADLLFQGAPAAGPVFEPPMVTKALDELDLAHRLVPSDLSIHQGRMYLALRSQDFDRAVRYLSEALSARPNDPLATWLEYLPNFKVKGPESGARYIRLLQQKYGDQQLLPLLGIYLVLAGKAQEAIGPLEAAVANDGADPRPHWLLGRALEDSGQLEAADREYVKSIALDHGTTRRERLCVLAGFVTTKLKNDRRAARLRKDGRCR